MSHCLIAPQIFDKNRTIVYRVNEGLLFDDVQWPFRPPPIYLSSRAKGIGQKHVELDARSKWLFSTAFINVILHVFQKTLKVLFSIIDPERW